MKNYLNLLGEIYINGNCKNDRTNTGTKSVFGKQLRFNLNEGFPLVTTKKCHTRSIIHELLWFLKGDTNIKYLNDNNVHIWDEWADKDGNLGPVYGHQWTKWDSTKLIYPSNYKNVDEYKEAITAIEARGYLRVGDIPDVVETMPVAVYRKLINQIDEAMHLLKTDPDSRRIMVSAWNVGDLDEMALQPCHSFFQFYTRELSAYERRTWLEKNDPEWAAKVYGIKKLSILQVYEAYDELIANSDAPTRELSCAYYMRSNDFFLGAPFNIASYALLTHMFAQQLGMAVGELVFNGGDVHLYKNHQEQALKQLGREPRKLPTLKFKRKPNSIYDYTFDDFIIEGYEPDSAIPAPVAI